MRDRIFLLTGMVFFCLAVPAWASSETVSRPQRIDRTLRCVQQTTAQPGLAWSDICSAASGQQSTFPKNRGEVIDQQLDQVQQQKNAPVKQTPALPKESVKPQVVHPQVALKLSPPDKPRLKAPSPDRTVSEAFPLPRRHTFGISYDVYSAKYKEPSVMEQKGPFFGYSGSYAYRPRPGDFLYFKGLNFYELQGQWADGDMDYSYAAGSLDDKHNVTYEARALAGADYAPDEKARLTPYSGLGYRYLRDESEGRRATSGAWGYDRHQEYYYLPLGVNVDFHTRPILFGFNLEFDYMFWGHNISETGYLPGYTDLKFTQRRGFGLRASVKLAKNFKLVNVFAQPFWRRWDIRSSSISDDRGTPSHEPENKTDEIGLKLGLEF